jgi:hypothetical protein
MTISPLEPPGGTFEGEGEVSCDTRIAVCESIAAEISGGSSIAGSGSGRVCAEDEWEDDAVGVYSDGRMEGK